MNLAVVSLIALLIAILISCTLKVNVGFLSIVFAWVIGVYLGGMSVKEVIAGFNHRGVVPGLRSRKRRRAGSV